MLLTILGCTVNCRFRFADCPVIHCGIYIENKGADQLHSYSAYSHMQKAGFLMTQLNMTEAGFLITTLLHSMSHVKAIMLRKLHSSYTASEGICLENLFFFSQSNFVKWIFFFH